MRIKLGIKVFSILSSMMLSLVVIAGCNEESTPSGTSPAGAPAGAPKAPGGSENKAPAPAPAGPAAEKPK